MINYVDLERPGAFDKNNPAAFVRFIDRLSKFKYINWKDMDPNSLELIMTPAIIGNPGSHYVCFVVNLKRQKYEFLNSLTGDTLYNKNGTERHVQLILFFSVSIVTTLSSRRS
ncbi:hypothetical protein P8452_36848 [Trifolium repens]|nr:hypothetical protein P8452_36848 [Trifolium repens]